MTRAAFYTARTWFAPPTAAQIEALAAAGCPAHWCSDALAPSPERGHYAWVGQVSARVAGAIVAKVHGDALHIEGWLAPSLRGLGLAAEALDGLASEVLVRVGHVPIGDDRSFTRRHSPTALVVRADSAEAARVAERCGARLRDGVWTLDLVGHTGLDRSLAIDGLRVAKLIASLRSPQGVALEQRALAHHERLGAAIAARKKPKPVARYRGVQELVDNPPTEPAAEADLDALLEHANATRIEDVLAVLRRKLFSDRQLMTIRGLLDDSNLPERERCEPWADLCDWLADYERVRRG
jgi:hypothetical protein